MCNNYFSLPPCPSGMYRSVSDCQCKWGTATGAPPTTTNTGTNTNSGTLPSQSNWLDTVTVIVDNATNVADSVNGFLNGGNNDSKGQSPIVIQQQQPANDGEDKMGVGMIALIAFIIIAVIGLIIWGVMATRRRNS